MLVKNKAIILFLLLAATSAKAQWCPNLLLGVSAGFARDNGLINVDLVYSGIPAFPYINADDEDQDRGLIRGVLAGIQGTNNRWLAGAEIHVNWNDMAHDRYFAFSDPYHFLRWNYHGIVKHGTNYGLLCRLGYEVTPYFLPYMHIGGEMSRDSYTATISGPRNLYPRSINLYNERWCYRFTGGVGMEFPIYLTPLGVRVQYMFHLPGTRLQANGAILDSGLNPLMSSDIKPKTQSIEGAIVWNL